MRRYPFGDLSKDRGRERLFSIGMLLGFVLGLVFPMQGWARFVAILIAFVIVGVRTRAQWLYPDRDPF